MYQIPFRSKTHRPKNHLIPNNETSQTPVEFDLVPASGPDLARLKSIVYADFSLLSVDWSKDRQDSVIAAFATGEGVFVNTVTAVRNLSVPAAMALQCGLIKELPTKPNPDNPGQKVPDPDAPFPITTGPAYARISGYWPALSMDVALQITELGSELRGADGRLFKQPSGSGGKATGTAKRSRARRVRPVSEGSATAASPSTPTEN